MHRGETSSSLTKRVTKILLKGSKVYLREFNEGDLGVWTSWFNDPEVTRYSVHRAATVEEQKKRLAVINQSSGDFQLALVENSSDKLIGTVGLHGINLTHRHGDISIIIGEKSVWGKGYGAEAVGLMVKHAFETLKLHRVTGGMFKDNLASYHLFKKLGFKDEAHLRESVFIDGRFKDVLGLSLLISEYQSRRGIFFTNK